MRPFRCHIKTKNAQLKVEKELKCSKKRIKYTNNKSNAQKQIEKQRNRRKKTHTIRNQTSKYHKIMFKKLEKKSSRAILVWDIQTIAEIEIKTNDFRKR